MQKVPKHYLLAAVLIVFSAQAQEIYRWHDKNGQLHVSQVPPPAGTDYEILSLDPKQAPQVVKAVRTGQASATKPVTAAQVQELQQQVNAVNAQLQIQNCAQAQENQQRLLADGPVAFNSTDGKPVPLNEEMRAEQLKIAQQHIAEFCR